MKFHNELNQKLFNKEELKPEVKEKLKEIAEAFIDYLEVNKDAIKDVVITGSSVSYNYTKYSDIDLHLKVDYDLIHEDCPIVEGYLWACKSTFNKDHDITIYGIPVEVYAESIEEDTVHNGLYSLWQDKWIDKPNKIPPTDNDSAVLSKYNELKEAADRIQDSEVASELIDKIYQMRKAGLQEAGEFSTENLAFKKLRDEGIIERLREMKKQKIDKELSLESYKESVDSIVIDNYLKMLRDGGHLLDVPGCKYLVQVFTNKELQSLIEFNDVRKAAEKFIEFTDIYTNDEDVVLFKQMRDNGKDIKTIDSTWLNVSNKNESIKESQEELIKEANKITNHGMLYMPVRKLAAKLMDRVKGTSDEEALKVAKMFFKETKNESIKESLKDEYKQAFDLLIRGENIVGTLDTDFGKQFVKDVESLYEIKSSKLKLRKAKELLRDLQGYLVDEQYDDYNAKIDKFMNNSKNESIKEELEEKEYQGCKYTILPDGKYCSIKIYAPKGYSFKNGDTWYSTETELKNADKKAKDIIDNEIELKESIKEEILPHNLPKLNKLMDRLNNSGYWKVTGEEIKVDHGFGTVAEQMDLTDLADEFRKIGFKVYVSHFSIQVDGLKDYMEKQNNKNESLNKLEETLKKATGMEINEGMWASPFTMENAKQVAELLSKPITYEELNSEEGKQKYWNIIGDDEFWDNVADEAFDIPEADARYLIVKFLQDWIETKENFNPDAYSQKAEDIIKKAIFMFNGITEDMDKSIKEDRLFNKQLTPLPSKEAKLNKGDKVTIDGQNGEIIEVRPMKMSDTCTYKIKLDNGKVTWRYEEEIINEEIKTSPLQRAISRAFAESEGIYKPSLIYAAYKLEQQWLKSLGLGQDEQAPEIMLFVINNPEEGIEDTKLVKREDVYTYTPEQNEYYLDMTRDSGDVITDYNLEPAAKLVDSWNLKEDAQTLTDKVDKAEQELQDIIKMVKVGYQEDNKLINNLNKLINEALEK